MAESRFPNFVTAHVDEGTGGMDARIGFETERRRFRERV
jgi:hypothetical protein